MDCAIPELALTSLLSRLTGDRRPYAAALELTRRCNNRCIHCYVDPVGHETVPEQGTEFWLGLLDALAAEQCVWLTLTGGDPLLRPDFAAIYEAAKRHGMVVAVFTNARLVTDAIADLFYELPPRVVSASIYGATRRTYDHVAQAPGAYDEAMAGLARLHARGVPVQLKTVAMRSNVHELDGMRDYAHERGWFFWYDSRIVPVRDGDRRVLAERLSPEEVVELDVGDAGRRESWESISATVAAQGRGRKVFACKDRKSVV